LEAAGRVADEDRAPALGNCGPILSAFHELSTERHVGMALGPIPMSKIVDYLERYGLPMWWGEVISAADSTFLQLQSKDDGEAA
jgi:hypothetical protein